jgi:hypothetical protein
LEKYVEMGLGDKPKVKFNQKRTDPHDGEEGSAGSPSSGTTRTLNVIEC